MDETQSKVTMRRARRNLSGPGEFTKPSPYPFTSSSGTSRWHQKDTQTIYTHPENKADEKEQGFGGYHTAIHVR